MSGTDIFRAFEIIFILKGFVMKKKIALMLSVIMLFSLAACSGGKTTQSNENSLAVCLASEPDTIDPALNSAVDGATMLAHLFSGLAKWSQDKDGNLKIVADSATELAEGVVNADGTVTYTYTLRDNLKWSDGKAVTAGDFVFAWNRAASFELAADYSYMFENVSADAALHVEFAKIAPAPSGDVFRITLHTGEGGAAALDGAPEVEEGGSRILTVTPEDGYRLARLTVNGLERTADENGRLALEGILEDLTIEVTFEKADGNDALYYIMIAVIVLIFAAVGYFFYQKRR